MNNVNTSTLTTVIKIIAAVLVIAAASAAIMIARYIFMPKMTPVETAEVEEVVENIVPTPEPEPEQATFTPEPDTFTEPRPQPEVVPEPEPEPISITLSFVGDCTLGSYMDYSGSFYAYEREYGYDYFFKNVADIFKSDDLTIVNFEGTLTDSYYAQEKEFVFKSEARYTNIMTGSGIEVCNIANNHIRDYGEEGFNDTVAALEGAGLEYYGYSKTAIVDVKGIKVAFVGGDLLTQGYAGADNACEYIAQLREQGADLVIATFHWGEEKEIMPDYSQTSAAHEAVAAGADLVIGHHPHVLQGIEEYEGVNIAYSIGNFCFGGNDFPSEFDTIIYQQTFTFSPDKELISTEQNIIPCCISSTYSINDFCPTPQTGDEAERIMKKLADRTDYIW